MLLILRYMSYYTHSFYTFYYHFFNFYLLTFFFFFFFQAEAGIRDLTVTEFRRVLFRSALLCTGFPYDVRERNDFARHFRNFIMSAQSVRRDGSAALDLAYVASGRFDGFYEEGLRP